MPGYTPVSLMQYGPIKSEEKTNNGSFASEPKNISGGILTAQRPKGPTGLCMLKCIPLDEARNIRFTDHPEEE